MGKNASYHAPAIDQRTGAELPAALACSATQLAALFQRRDWQQRGAQYLRALLTSPAVRRNAEQLAAAVAGATPRAFQRFLSEAPWDHCPIIDGLQAMLGPLLQSEQGRWVLKEIAFAKQGHHSVGVARQTSGVYGAPQNCQIGLFLGYASPLAQAFVDMQLYLPRTWTEDAVRRYEAGVPDTVPYRSKADLALGLLRRARTRGQLTSQWVTGAGDCGQEAAFREALDAEGWWYLLKVPGTLPVFTEPTVSRKLPVLSVGNGRRHGPGLSLPCTPYPWKIRGLAACVPLAGWQHLAEDSATRSAQSLQWIALRVWDERERRPGREHWLLLHRDRDGGGSRYYLSNAPVTMPAETLVRMSSAGTTATTALDQSQSVIGLNAYEVRSWQGWYHHMTLCLLASAFLVQLQHAKR